MTTYFQFQPPANAPFAFQPTLDGNQYNATVTWLFWAQRWYVNLFDQFGNRVLSRAMAESPPLQAISSVAWSDATGAGLVTVVPTVPTVYKPGSLAPLYFYQNAPAAFNGFQLCAVVNPSVLTYPLASDPGQASALGAFGQDLSLTSGYFASTLVWRPSSGNIEVTP